MLTAFFCDNKMLLKKYSRIVQSLSEKGASLARQEVTTELKVLQSLLESGDWSKLSPIQSELYRTDGPPELTYLRLIGQDWWQHYSCGSNSLHQIFLLRSSILLMMAQGLRGGRQ